jgi:hypothetical protein
LAKVNKYNLSELDKFCIVDEVGLMNQFKQNIGIK